MTWHPKEAQECDYVGSTAPWQAVQKDKSLVTVCNWALMLGNSYTQRCVDGADLKLAYHSCIYSTIISKQNCTIVCNPWFWYLQENLLLYIHLASAGNFYMFQYYKKLLKTQLSIESRNCDWAVYWNRIDQIWLRNCILKIVVIFKWTLDIFYFIFIFRLLVPRIIWQKKQTEKEKCVHSHI